jgi:hypothetical protein
MLDDRMCGAHAHIASRTHLTVTPAQPDTRAGCLMSSCSTQHVSRPWRREISDIASSEAGVHPSSILRASRKPAPRFPATRVDVTPLGVEQTQVVCAPRRRRRLVFARGWWGWPRRRRRAQRQRAGCMGGQRRQRGGWGRRSAPLHRVPAAEHPGEGGRGRRRLAGGGAGSGGGRARAGGGRHLPPERARALPGRYVAEPAASGEPSQPAPAPKQVGRPDIPTGGAGRAGGAVPRAILQQWQ